MSRANRSHQWLSIILVLGLVIGGVLPLWAAMQNGLDAAAGPTAVSGTLTVNTTGDDQDAAPGDGLCADSAGDCSLRAALEEANATPGVDTITFAIAGAGPHTIRPGAELPAITDPVIIDGAAEPDYADKPVIELDGALAGGRASGLAFTVGDSLVRGLAIHSFGYSGVYFLGGSSSQLESSYLGADATGAAAPGNQIGVLLEGSADNTISGNLIAGNEVGVYLYGSGASGNIVSGNSIGLDAGGANVLGNGYGIRITRAAGNTIGGKQPAARNLISGNQTGVYIYGAAASGNHLWGNYIGLDATGQQIMGNEETGVYIHDAPGNQVGGLNAAGNVIAGGELGVYLRGQNAHSNLVQGNLIGVDAGAVIPSQRLSGGVLVVDAANNQVGGPQPRHGNQIVSQQYGLRLRGSAANSNLQENNLIDVIGDQGEDTAGGGAAGLFPKPGLSLIAHAQTPPPVAIAGRRPLLNTNGILSPPGQAAADRQRLSKTASSPLVQTGTTFTVTVTGDGVDANPGDGLCADSAGNCTLRAAIAEANTTAGADSIIFNIPGGGPHTIQPGSELPIITDPVVINGTIEPDYVDKPVIELDGTNAGALANGLKVEASNTTIRGLAINRFDDDGIDLDEGTTGAVVEGNFIGTDVDGVTALGNLDDGMDISESSNNQIGGAAVGVGNLIAGNGDHGLTIKGSGADGNVIQGNIIGADLSGMVALGNGRDGIYISSGVDHVIGGTAAGAGNLIVASDDDGIELGPGAAGALIQGNIIGLNAAGAAALGNGDRGVELDRSPGNTVGGTTAAARNLISGNLGWFPMM